MPYNRVLGKDRLANLLMDYRGQLKDKEVAEPEKLKRFRTFLEKFSHHDEAYTETNLKTGEITWSMGVEKWLGHIMPSPEKPPADHMEQFAHPFIQDWYSCYIIAITLVFIGRRFKYLKSRFTVTVPMKNHKEEWLLVKVMSMPFGLTKEGQLVTMIHSYSIFGAYRGEALKMEIWDANEKIPDKDDIYIEFRKSIAGCMDFGPLPNLTKISYKYATIIRSLIEDQKRVDAETLWNAYKKTYSKVQKKTVNKGVQRMHQRLIDLLGCDELTDADIAPWQPFRPGQEDHFPLIQFCVESGIVDLLKSYK